MAAVALLSLGIVIGVGIATLVRDDGVALDPGPTSPSSEVTSEEPRSPVAGTTGPAASPTDGAREPTAPPGAATVDGPSAQTYRVIELDDGDSFDVVGPTGGLITVRMAQVDAPELSECLGQDAKAWLTSRILDRDVTLEPTTDGPDEDQYGRKVREVWLDGQSLNVEIVRAGYATHFASFASEDPDLAVRIEAAEEEARAAGRGLWSTCRAPTSSGAAAAHTGRTDGGWACHPAYRECLPAHVHDLDCAEIGHQVVLLGDEDPWRLDGNNTHRTDGFGCERFEPWSPDEEYPYY